MTDRIDVSALTIAFAWKCYVAEVVPADASRVQVTECRRAFYAGAQALLNLMNAGFSPGDDPTDADLQFLKSLEDELRQFSLDQSEHADGAPHE